MGHLRKRALRWTAPLALVAAAGLAACGDDDATTAETAGVSTGTVGSDVHLENRAAEIAERYSATVGSDVHLENQAAEIAERGSTTVGSDVHLENQAAEIAERGSSPVGNDVHLVNQAAEIAERQAHLDGNGTTYSSASQPDPASSTDEFVPGTRHMPVR